MQKIKFIKMHGLGNDFVIIDRRKDIIEINDNLIKKLSDRRTGAGCDQLITINNTNNKNVDIKIDIFNPAGDRAEACGNGTRCVAKILFDENNEKETLKILSDAGTLIAKKAGDEISVNMGKMTTDWEKIPLSEEISFGNFFSSNLFIRFLKELYLPIYLRSIAFEQNVIYLSTEFVFSKLYLFSTIKLNLPQKKLFAFLDNNLLPLQIIKCGDEHAF